jgi:hypothetical protein
MTFGPASPIAVAATLVTGCGALGSPEAEAPLSDFASSGCTQPPTVRQAARPPSQAYGSLIP